MKSNTPIPAESVYIKTIGTKGPPAWATFAYTDAGDLMLHSDYGQYATAWRSYGNGNSFANWLTTCNAEYIVGKFETNFIAMTAKRLPTIRKNILMELVEDFLDYMKKHHA